MYFFPCSQPPHSAMNKLSILPSSFSAHIPSLQESLCRKSSIAKISVLHSSRSHLSPVVFTALVDNYYLHTCLSKIGIFIIVLFFVFLALRNITVISLLASYVKFSPIYTRIFLKQKVHYANVSHDVCSCFFL